MKPYVGQIVVDTQGSAFEVTGVSGQRIDLRSGTAYFQTHVAAFGVSIKPKVGPYVGEMVVSRPPFAKRNHLFQVIALHSSGFTFEVVGPPSVSNGPLICTSSEYGHTIHTWDGEPLYPGGTLAASGPPLPKQDDQIPPTLRAGASDGMACAKCCDYFPMAVPNQPDGKTLICYSCRQSMPKIAPVAEPVAPAVVDVGDAEGAKLHQGWNLRNGRRRP